MIVRVKRGKAFENSGRTCFTTVHTESVLLSYEAFVEPQTFGHYTAGIRAGPAWRCLLAGRHAAGHRVNQY